MIVCDIPQQSNLDMWSSAAILHVFIKLNKIALLTIIQNILTNKGERFKLPITLVNNC